MSATKTLSKAQLVIGNYLILTFAFLLFTFYFCL